MARLLNITALMVTVLALTAAAYGGPATPAGSTSGSAGFQRPHGAIALASAADMEAGLGVDNSHDNFSTSGGDTASRIVLSGRDRGFVLLVFICSLIAALAAAASIIIKVRRSRQEGGELTHSAGSRQGFR